MVKAALLTFYDQCGHFYFSGGRSNSKSPKIPSNEDESEFPTARGLVATKKRL